MSANIIRKIVLILAIVLVASAAVTSVLIRYALTSRTKENALSGGNRQPYSESWTLTTAPGSTFGVDLDSVNVVVQGYDGKEIQASFEGYTTPDNSGVHPRIVAQEGDKEIRFMHSKQGQSSGLLHIGPTIGSRNTINGLLTVQIPRSLALDMDVNLFSGSVTAENHTLGDVSLSTSSGKITAHDVSATGNLTLHTFSGNMELLRSTALEGSLDASSGGITADTLTLTSLSISQFSGKLSLKNCTVQGDVNLDTSSGNTTVEQLSAANLEMGGFSGAYRLTDAVISNVLSIHSSSGDIVCENVTAQSTDCVTFSGKITGTNLRTQKLKTDTSSGDVKAALLTNADLDCHSFSGKVIITMPADYQFQLEMKTFSGKTDIGYPITLHKQSSDSSQGIAGVVGSGTYQATFDTSSGNISLQPTQG